MKAREMVLVAWWGALAGGGATVGDALALRAVARKLAAAGVPAHLAAGDVLGNMPLPSVDWQLVRPDDYRQLVFVCGPMISGSQAQRALFARFAHCRTIGVGVSILPKSSPDHWNPFTITLARDGTPVEYGDVALFTEVAAREPTPRNGFRLGVCLRGRQREYGEEFCLHELAHTLIRDVVAALCVEAISIETRMDRYTAAAPEQAIQHALTHVDLVVTTRLHGALLAVQCDVPVLALDQIAGGAKVHSVLTWLGYPYVYRADTARPDEFLAVARRLLAKEAAEPLRKLKERARGEAERTLDIMLQILVS